jgi:DNA polymerase (family 10)
MQPSPTLPRLSLANGEAIAAKIISALAPMCERIEVAGSIRRRRQSVGDVDIVLLPKPGELNSIAARLDRNTEVIQDGESNKIRILHLPNLGLSVQIDVFVAKPAEGTLLETIPSNFGSILLCRTGCVSHNIRLVQRAKIRCLEWDYTRGVLNAAGKVLASAEESDIYRVLDLPFQEPQNREVPQF